MGVYGCGEPSTVKTAKKSVGILYFGLNFCPYKYNGQVKYTSTVVYLHTNVEMSYVVLCSFSVVGIGKRIIHIDRTYIRVLILEVLVYDYLLSEIGFSNVPSVCTRYVLSPLPKSTALSRNLFGGSD